MSDLYPLVEMSVVLILDEQNRFLLDYKESWGGFAFPCTKLRELAPSEDGTLAQETPHLAACRAVVEVLGVPIDPSALAPLPHEVPTWQQSVRTGEWKRYRVHLFGLTVRGQTPQPLPGHRIVWLTRAEMKTVEPVSPTVQKILGVVP
jgi:hypothetical protein